MALLAYDEVWLREPRLLIPRRKPVGKVRLRSESPFVKNATDLLLFNDSRVPPVDAKTGVAWTAVTTDGSVPYSYVPVNGTLCFKNMDSDRNGICYSSPILNDSQIDVDPTIPTALVLWYIFLANPTVVNEGLLSISETYESGTPRLAVNSESTSAYKVYVNGGNRFTGIAALPMTHQFMAYKYYGSNHYFLSSAKNIGWETYSSANTNESANSKIFLGSAYQAQALAAFSLFWHSYGWAPDLPQLEEFARNPWPELVVPA